MRWLLKQGPLTHRIFRQGGFWHSSLFAWHLTHFLCMAFDADWNRCHLTQINFICQLTQINLICQLMQNYVRGNWRRMSFFKYFFYLFFISFSFFLLTVKFWCIHTLMVFDAVNFDADELWNSEFWRSSFLACQLTQMNFDTVNFDADELCMSFDAIFGVSIDTEDFLHAFQFRFVFCICEV